MRELVKEGEKQAEEEKIMDEARKKRKGQIKKVVSPQKLKDSVIFQLQFKRQNLNPSRLFVEWGAVVWK